MGEVLLVERPAPAVTLLTLNRPEVMNAIDMAMAQALSEALDAAAEDDTVRAVVIAGAGRAFSAGFDIHEMARFDADGMVAAFVKRDPLMWKVADHPKPVIAALTGVTYGAGALIAAAADLRIGGPATRFRVTATKYGGANATWSLPAIVGAAKAKEILMTGRSVEAEEMLAIGLLNRLVQDHEVTPYALELAAAIAGNPPEGVRWVKRLINEGVGRTLADGFRAENVAMSSAMRPAPGADTFADFLARRPQKEA